MGLFKHKLHKSEILKWGILGGAAEAVYIFLITLFMTAMAGKGDPGSATTGIIMLIIMVISVMVSAILVIGKPFDYFLKKKIKEGVLTFFTTLITLIIIVTLVIIFTL